LYPFSKVLIILLLLAGKCHLKLKEKARGDDGFTFRKMPAIKTIWEGQQRSPDEGRKKVGPSLMGRPCQNGGRTD
jgi:hypothetical protein